MAYFSLKQSPYRISSNLPVQRRSPPPPPPPPAIKSLPSKNQTLKPLHLSSSPANTYSHFPHRDVSCPCSASPAPGPAPAQQSNLLNFLFFKPDPYNLTRWTVKVIFTAVCYTTYVLTSKMLLDSFPFPCPWLLSTIYLAAGFLFMHISYEFRLCGYVRPYAPRSFFNTLRPVAAVHAVGVVAEIMCLSKVSAVSTHIMRCAEPVFMVLLSSLLCGESFPFSVYLSLIPIIGGVALAAVTDVQFNRTGFVAAMVANIAFALTNILADKAMKKTEWHNVTSVQYYGCLSLMSLLMVLPLAVGFEDPRMWAAGWRIATSKYRVGAMIMLVVATTICYHMYNEEAYRFFPTIQPFPFLTVNTAKKIFVIVSAIIFVGTPVQPMIALGAAIAILGIFVYSREICKISRIKSWYL